VIHTFVIIALLGAGLWLARGSRSDPYLSEPDTDYDSD
jgi:FtsZ-interacting cell division protein ZipA